MKFITHKFMKKIQFLTCIILLTYLLNACSSNKLKTINGNVWKIVWEENFNSKTLNLDKWSRAPRNTPDWSNYMSNHEDVLRINNGKLFLRGIVNPDTKKDNVPYLTGGVLTKGKFAYTFGKIEIRAKLENAQGAWPAIWMLPDQPKYGEYPRNGEIDLMERLNSDKIVYQTVHSYYTLKLRKTKNPISGSTSKLEPEKYNTYGLEWFPDKLIFTINGEETFVYPKLDNVDKSQWPFDQPFYLILSMQLEGNWVGKANPEDLPVQMIVDWVKVYQQKK